VETGAPTDAPIATIIANGPVRQFRLSMSERFASGEPKKQKKIASGDAGRS